jgi:ABC-type lipoprotein release transport system permease subunit
MALESIKEKKVRSFLTMLGIIIGVTAVLVLVALVSGYNADVTAYYEKLGVNKVTVSLTWYDTTRATDITDSLYEYGNSLTGMVTGVTPDLSTTGALRYYYPDFVVRLDDDTHVIVETKGLEDPEVARKDRRAARWCEDATALTGDSWDYLKVPQKVFEASTASTFEQLVRHVEVMIP